MYRVFSDVQQMVKRYLSGVRVAPTREALCPSLRTLARECAFPCAAVRLRSGSGTRTRSPVSLSGCTEAQLDSFSYGRPTEAQLAEAAKKSRATRHERLPSASGRVGAIDRLHKVLAINAVLYEEELLQSQRDAVSRSLLAVRTFLTEQGFPSSTLATILRPVEALFELEKTPSIQCFRSA